MNALLNSLLALQDHDDAISGLEGKIAALAPRFAALDAERNVAERAVTAAKAAVTQEERRRDELTIRTDELRKINERALSHVEHVRKAHEANAAAAEIDLSRRALVEVETEMQTVTHRLTNLRTAAQTAADALTALVERQAKARGDLDAVRATLATEVAAARVHRDTAAGAVDPGTRLKYDRVRSRRRRTSLYALRGLSCSNCDTAIPTQRRSILAGGGAVDICESCGVLLYSAAE